MIKAMIIKFKNNNIIIKKFENKKKLKIRKVDERDGKTHVDDVVEDVNEPTICCWLLSG